MKKGHRIGTHEHSERTSLFLFYTTWFRKSREYECVQRSCLRSKSRQPVRGLFHSHSGSGAFTYDDTALVDGHGSIKGTSGWLTIIITPSALGASRPADHHCGTVVQYGRKHTAIG